MNNSIISYFGYPTFDQYLAAHLATLHTAALREKFTETLEQHNRRVRQLITPGFFDSIIIFVRAEWARDPNAYRGSSIAWYFHHPETRKLVPADFLKEHDSICGPRAPAYG